MSVEDLFYNALLDEGHDSQTARDAAKACANTMTGYSIVGTALGTAAGGLIGRLAGVGIGAGTGFLGGPAYAFFKSSSCTDAREAVKRSVNPLWQLEKITDR